MKDSSFGDERAMSRDDAALLHLVARQLAAVEDVAELRDVLDLLMVRLGASSALLTILDASRDEPLRFLVGNEEKEPLLEALVVQLRGNHQQPFVSSPEPSQHEPVSPDLEHRETAVAVPIQGQSGNLVGVLAITHPRRDILDGSYATLLTGVGYQMIAALRQARLASENRRRAYEISVLDEIGQAFSSLDLGQLLRLILERTSRTLRVNRSVLFMLDEENQELILRAVDHPGASGEALGLRIPLSDRPHVADAIRTRQPVEVQDIYADPRWRGFWAKAREMGLEAALAVPLVAKGRAIGAISLDRTIARAPFTPNEIALCQIIANQAASAIENARLYGETRRYAYETRLRMAALDQHARRLALLNRISTTLVRSLEAEFAPTITAEIAQILDVAQSVLFVLHPDGVTGQVLACYPPMAQTDDLPIDIALSDPSSVEPLLQAEAPLLVKDVHANALLKPARSLFETRNIESLLVVPMTVAGQIQGIIGLDVTKRSVPLDPDDLELAMTIGNQVAFVLANAQLYTAAEQRAAENARLYQEAQRRADQLRLINEVSEEISSILDIDLLLWSVVRLIRETLDCYHVAIALTEDDELVFKANVGYLYEYEDTRLVNTRLQIAAEEGVAGWVARHGKPLLVPDVRQEPRYTTNLGFDGTRSEVAVPLKLGDRVIGVLDAHGSRFNEFDESDLVLLQSLATQIAVTVENARLFGVAYGERAKLETIIDGAEEVVLVTDEEGRMVLMNRAAERAFHVTAMEALGYPLLDVVDNLNVHRLWRDSLQADSFPVVGEIALDDGRTLYASVASVRRVGLVAVMQDVSHLKELDRMKSDFVSTVSHDLRSPLQAVRINLEVLPIMGPLNPEQREAVDSSLRVLARITQLVRDLLDLGHIEADVGMERGSCSLDEIITTTVEDVQPRVRVLNLRLEAQVSQDLPTVYGDANRLAQVVANLVDNAIKYTPAGGSIRVGARQSDGEVVVEVRDDGPGIAPEHRARLFEKFYRIPSVQQQKVEGTGLGLAIVKSIVEAHDGRVWVESSTEPEVHGSTFGFAVPIAAASEG